MAFDYLEYRRNYDRKHPDKSVRNREKGALNLLHALGYVVTQPDPETYNTRFTAYVEQLRTKRTGGGDA